MSARIPDRSWTVAPTFLWFGVVLGLGIFYFDHDIRALADRLTTPRDSSQAAAAGPVFTAPPVTAAEADDNDPAPAPLPAPAGSHDSGALADTCIEPGPTACKRWAMDSFYRAVADSKGGKLGRPLRASWYGDSVVATDAIPGRFRTRLQGELGDGGPGYVFVVPPHRFCDHEAITRSSSGVWYTHAISTMQTADGLYGFGGSTTETTGGGSTIKLVSGKVTTAELYYLAQPNGGTAVVTGDGQELVRADTQADAKAPAWSSGTAPAGAAKIEIKTTGRVRLFGIDLENASGAVVDNLGIVSVNVKSFKVNDPAHWSAELGHRGSDLVLIMIGANEAQWLAPGDRDTKDYQIHYETILAPIRKGLPNASCLVVSPTDQAEAKDGVYPSRAVMPLLIDAQRKAAQAQGCAFYSTYDWMGGKGSAAKWFAKGMVGSDFQHLAKKGANKLSDGLFDALMTGYQRYARK